MKKGRITGAKAIVKSLERHGVTVMFGYPGGATLPIYDELARSRIRHVLSRHEQGAAHMADGYARATGRTGVCMATSGPGATNLVTGIATAYMDSSPIVAITGQVPRSMIGNDAFQEVDITGITIPITKHNYLVQEAADLPTVFAEAFHLASTGRRGPVLVDIPKDVQTDECPADAREPGRPALEGYRPTIAGHPGQIKRAAALLREARRPVAIVGGGLLWSGGTASLVRLCESLDIPAAYTLMGKSAFPNSHPLCLGMAGYHGRIAANTAVSRADLILAVGTRFTDRATGPLERYASGARIIHIDIDPAEIGKNTPAFLPIVGEAGDILPKLLDELMKDPPRRDRPEWTGMLKETEAAHPLRDPCRSQSLSIPGLLRIVRDVVPDPIIVTDVGRHQIFAAHHVRTESPRDFITSGGLGTMGFGLPAAIGAKLGRPERNVVVVSGDGSFMMNCQEVATAVEAEVPIVALVMNDGGLGMIRQLQDTSYGKRHTMCGFRTIVDFAGLARSMGAFGRRVERMEDAGPALEEAIASGRPAVIDCAVSAEANVYPMVTGASLLEYVE